MLNLVHDVIPRGFKQDSGKRVSLFIVLREFHFMKRAVTESIFSVVCSRDILEQHTIIDLVRQRSPSDGSGSELRYWVGFFGVVSLPLKTAFGTIGNCRLRLY